MYKPSVVELEGDNYGMGYQYGRKCSNIIRECIGTNYQIIEYYTKLSREECIKRIRKFIPILKEEVPHLLDEMKGISDGSKIPLDDILVHNFHARDLLNGCTLVHVTGNIAEDGKAMTAQTVDWTPMLQPYYHVLKLNPDNSPPILMFTLAGIIGLVGRNKHGMNVFMNILLTSEEISYGVPAYLLLRLSMESRGVDEALNRLKYIRRASPFNYLLSDEEGKTVNIEATPNVFHTQYVYDGFFVHTNHCLSEVLKECDVYAQVTNSDETFQRFNRAEQLLSEKTNGEKISLNDLMNILRDHHNYPNSICRHPIDSLPPPARMATLGAVIVKQREDCIWVSFGRTCESDFHKICF